MVKLTQSLQQWLSQYHKDLLSPLLFGHLELFTTELQSEYLSWCQTDEGRKYLTGGSEYKEDEGMIVDTLFNSISEAIQKQTPKAVEHSATLYRDGTCPSCSNVVSEHEQWGEQTVRIENEYCRFCGQHLDWSGFTETPPDKYT